MLLGVLDIGSNSAQLQVFEVRTGAPPLPTHAVKEPTLLGEAFDPAGGIDLGGIDRVVGAVNRAMDSARRLGVQQLFVFTTSAVRDATNRDLILDRLEEEAGVRPQFLSGTDEGRLTYLAVHQWYGWSAGRQLVLDIGGGSMEIVFGRDAEPELSVSLPLGAGRLTRAFLPDDPPSWEQLAALRRHVRTTLREVADRLLWEGVPDRVIGTSKTFKQLARLSGSPAQRKGPFVRRAVEAADLDTWIPRLASLDARERARLSGVSRSRSRQILAGAVVAKAAMKTLNVHSVDVCPWALREGIVLHYLQSTHNESFDLPLRPLLGATYQRGRPALESDGREALAGLQPGRVTAWVDDGPAGYGLVAEAGAEQGGWYLRGVGDPQLAPGTLVEGGLAEPDHAGAAGPRPKVNALSCLDVAGDLPVDLDGQPSGGRQQLQRDGVLDRQHDAAVVRRMRRGWRD
jgi:exopolyphosphatase/guanosine-5'-triphosphate,3'-diphosphate pyrophosphatase